MLVGGDKNKKEVKIIVPYSKFPAESIAIPENRSDEGLAAYRGNSLDLAAFL
jgi:hypothetical protein